MVYMSNNFKISVSPRTTRFVLIDYDNVRAHQASSMGPLQTIVTHVINRLMRDADFLTGIKSGERIKTRLYGGWFEECRVTRLAQDIYTEIGQSFPVHLKTRDGVPFDVDCERADRMLSRPNEALYCTYREDDLDSKVKVRQKYCCEKNRTISEYVKAACEIPRQCPSCKSTWSKPFFIARVQKMVDAMIFCDLGFLLRDKDNMVALVSSDADMLPVLFQSEADQRNVYYLRDMNGYDAGFYTRYHSRLLGQYCRTLTW